MAKINTTVLPTATEEYEALQFDTLIRILETKLINTTGSSVWDSENRFLFYAKKNENTLRSETILRYDTFKNIEKKIFHDLL